MDIDIKYDPRALALFQTGASNRTIQKAVTKAVVKAGSDAIRKVRVESSRETRARKKLKAGFVNKGLPTNRSGSPSKLDSLEWTMKISGKPIPLGQYPHKQTAKGVTVYVNTGGRKLVKGAFVATMRSGHRGVFARMGKKRLPIEELYSSTIANVFGDADMIPKVHAFGQTAFETTFDRVLPHELSKLLP